MMLEKLKNNIFIAFILKRKVIVLLILALILIYLNFRGRNTPSVDVAEATKGSLIQSITTSGEVSADQFARLSFQGMGEIESINVTEGSLVQKGELIARLNTDDLYQSFLAAEAQLRSAEAALASTYDTLQGHEKNESFAQIATRTQAETARDVAYRNYVTARQALNHYRLTAPFGGILTDITDGVVAGSYATPATAVFTVVDPKTVYFKAEISEIDVSSIFVGQKVLVKLDAFPDRVFEESIRDIGFSSITTSTGGTAYPVKITLEQNFDKVRLGMNGDAEFILETKDDVLIVPTTAIVEKDDKTFVWVVDSGKAKEVEVVTGISSIDDTEILDGVSEGQWVILRAPSGLKEGIKVNIK